MVQATPFTKSLRASVESQGPYQADRPRVDGRVVPGIALHFDTTGIAEVSEECPGEIDECCFSSLAV